MTDGRGERALLAALASGEFVSGQRCAERLGVSRARVWQLVRGLGELGYTIDAIPGRGYRWQSPHAPLDSGAIARGLPWPMGIEVHWSLTSTNDRVVEARPHAAIVFAEHQTAGRGRLGREWLSPPGGLYFSAGWWFAHLERGPQGLSPWVAVHLVEALRELGLDRVGAKWPNDLVAGAGKLGGVLIEMAGDPFGRCHVCVGVGLNWADPPASGQPAVGLTSLTAAAPERNVVAGRVAGAVAAALEAYADAAPAALPARWATVDALRGETVILWQSDMAVRGMADGIDPDGALRLITDSGLERYRTGDTRLRRA